MTARTGRGRRWAPFAILLVGLAGTATLFAAGGDSAKQPGASCSWGEILSTHSARWPACHRPYAEDSPFNTSLGSSPQLAASSPGGAAWLGRFPLSSLVFGDPARDGGVPVYTSRPGDPLYKLHCIKPWGRCEIEGERIHIPSVARPAGVWPDPPYPTDGHMTVVDPRTKWEYDLWAVQRKARRGGKLDFAWGGRTKIDGSGLDSAAVAARYGTLAGPIRAEELIRGRIEHALTITVPCSRGRVFPARGRSLSCAEAGLPGQGAPAMGTRYQLDLSDEQIAALGVPGWQQAILRAFARYGAFVSDTTGQPHWGLEYESPASFTSFGKRDPRIALARGLGSVSQDFNHNGETEYWLYFSPSIDWTKLRVIAPCVSRGSCD